VQQCVAVRAAVCGSAAVCSSEAVYGSVQARMSAAVHADVCGSARGSVWQCLQECAADQQCAVVCGVRCAVCAVWHFNSCSVRRVRSSVWQCARQCAAVQQCARQCAAVQRCGSVLQSGSELIFK
jgi:hypothetical protein